MNFPATIYVQDNGRRLWPTTTPEESLRHGPGTLVGVYTLQRTVTIQQGALAVTDTVPPVDEPLPAQLVVQMNRSGMLQLNRTPQGAVQNSHLGDGTYGIYVRSRYVQIAPAVTLTDVAPAAVAGTQT